MIQILCWILLPVAAIVMLLTVLFHYRRRKQAMRQSTVSEEEFMKASPELLGYTNGDGAYIFFDQSSVIAEYKKKLSYHHARYTALRHDFEKLETKYTALAGYAAAKSMNARSIDVESTLRQIPKSLQVEIDNISAQHKAEKEELLKQLGQLKPVNQNLENEIQGLRDQLNMQSVHEDEKLAVLNRWKEDNTTLRRKVTEQQYMQDLLAEKNTQVEFLQLQLEQQRKDDLAELKVEKLQHSETTEKVDALKFEVLQRQEEFDKLQMVLCGKEEQLIENQHAINTKVAYITWLENILTETKQQNELLHTMAADYKNNSLSLQDQLKAAQETNEQLSENLATNVLLLQRLNKDISSILSEDVGQSPVIALRPEYAGNEELAAQ